MTTTTVLSSYETTNVTDKDLLQLINTYKSIREHYIIREHSILVPKRVFLIFEINKPEIIYDVYYKPNTKSTTNVQVLFCNKTYETVYSYFLGLFNGIKQ